MSRLFVTLQYLLPHHLLCRIVYALMRVRTSWLKNLLIGAFVRAYRPEMADAVEPDPRRYETFNAFFTRALRTDARPIDPDPHRLVSPCDGTLSVAGSLVANRMLQAKGHHYTVEALLAAQKQLTDSFSEGLYTTIYLAPYNYHRLHMPLSGRLREAWYIPGRLFSVNSTTVERVPGLFALNERVVCLFDGDRSPFVLVLVGALFVGSMSTVWHGQITPWRGVLSRSNATPIRLRTDTGADPWRERGAEFARFNMGSTIVMMMPPGTARWDQALRPGQRLVVGQGLGSINISSAS
jgi:phosphatidylserine decarboxylase